MQHNMSVKTMSSAELAECRNLKGLLTTGVQQVIITDFAIQQFIRQISRILSKRTCIKRYHLGFWFIEPLEFLQYPCRWNHTRHGYYGELFAQILHATVPVELWQTDGRTDRQSQCTYCTSISLYIVNVSDVGNWSVQKFWCPEFRKKFQRELPWVF